MRIYVDFDDCLCETGRAFSKLVLEMFNKHVPYDQIHYFELDRSFDLDAEQYERFMLRGHEPEILLSFDATPGAAETINEWISCGHEVSIITGRPSSVYEPSRIWLDEHGLKNARLYCLNKYGRDHFIKNSNSTLELEDYYRMKFERRSDFSNICRNLRFWCLTDHGTENVLFRMETIKDAPIGRAFARSLQVSKKIPEEII